MKPTLILSIGHHEKARGARWNSLDEYTQASKWIYYIAGKLSNNHDIDIYVVESGTLKEKVKRVNELYNQYISHNNVLAVELHFNAAGGRYISGNETLYYPGSKKGKQSALNFNNFFVDFYNDLYNVDIKNRGAKEGWYKMDRPNIVDYPGDIPGDETVDYFLRKTNCTALILEPHFLCELEDDIIWTQSADCIARALKQTIMKL